MTGEPARTADGRQIHPQRTLWLLSIAHAFNHAQAVLLPLIYLEVISEFGVGVGEIAFVAAAVRPLRAAPTPQRIDGVPPMRSSEPSM